MKVRTIFKDERGGGFLERDLVLNDKFLYGLFQMIGSGHTEDHLKLDSGWDYIFDLEQYVSRILLMETDYCYWLKFYSIAVLSDDGSADEDFDIVSWMDEHRMEVTA